MEWEASEGMELTALSDADFLTKVVIIASFIGIALSSSGLILSRSDSPIGGMVATDTRITDYPYYDYSDDYAYNDSAPVYDERFWQDLATRVQSALARRGYYRGQINGVIDSDSRQAIRDFQKAQGLPVTGLIDPGVLRALNLPVPKIPSHSG